VAEFRHWPKAGLDALRLSANRRENRHPGPPGVLQEIVPRFQKQFRCRYPSLDRPKCRFSNPPKSVLTRSDPALQLVSIFDPSRKADFAFPVRYQTRQAAGRLAVEVPPEVARALIFDLGRGPRESGRQGLAVLSPRILARENRIPPSRRRESLRSLVRRWQVGYHPKSLQAPLRAYVAIHAGVVSSKHGWNSDTVSSTSRPQGIKWTTTCLEAMILSVYVR
jgi:hypothetical protein